jgi:hypothetical protein
MKIILPNSENYENYCIVTLLGIALMLENLFLQVDMRRNTVKSYVKNKFLCENKKKLQVNMRRITHIQNSRKYSSTLFSACLL